MSKPKFGKRLRKMMKNLPKRGKSARRGNMPSPYTKYNKVAYVYSGKTRKGPTPLLIIDNSSDYTKPSRMDQRRVSQG